MLGSPKTASAVEGAAFLTPEEVVDRYRGEISVGTLRNWRAMRIGPDYVKVGKSVLYPLEKLIEWDRRNIVICNPRAVRGNEPERSV